jgi:YVTN family beta-propeller protein
MGVVLSPDESRVFVTTRTGNTVAVVDAARAEKTGEVALPGQPVRMRFAPDGRRLLVTLIEAGDVAVVDVRTLAVVHRFHVGTATEGIQVDAVEGVGYASAQGDDRVVKFGLDDYRRRLEVATESRPDPIEVLR